MVRRRVLSLRLKAQYIWWLAGGVVSLMGLFAVLYIAGVGAVVCLGLIGVLGTILFLQVYRLSRVYGEHGLMKRGAARRVPRRVRSGTRIIFKKERPWN
jgi:hypothetical protein